MSQNTSSTISLEQTGNQQLSTGSTTGNAGTGAATATGLGAYRARVWRENFGKLRGQAKDYVSDKVTIVGDKFKRTSECGPR